MNRRNNYQPATYLSFDGSTSSHVDLGATNIVPNGSTAFSGVVWVYLKGFGTGSTDSIRTIIGNRRDSTTSGWLWKIAANAIGKQEFTFYNPAGGNRSWISTVSVPVGRWAHLAVVFTGTQTTFYVDGNPDVGATISSTTISENTSDNIRIGHRIAAGGTFEHFQGNMAYLALYSRALTADEVKTAYEAQTLSATSRLGYWVMDDGSGTTVVDTDGAHNGTIVGGVTWSTTSLVPARSTGSRSAAGSRTAAGIRSTI